MLRILFLVLEDEGESIKEIEMFDRKGMKCDEPVLL